MRVDRRSYQSSSIRTATSGSSQFEVMGQWTRRVAEGGPTCEMNLGRLPRAWTAGACKRRGSSRPDVNSLCAKTGDELAVVGVVSGLDGHVFSSPANLRRAIRYRLRRLQVRSPLDLFFSDPNCSVAIFGRFIPPSRRVYARERARAIWRTRMVERASMDP